MGGPVAHVLNVLMLSFQAGTSDRGPVASSKEFVSEMCLLYGGVLLFFFFFFFFFSSSSMTKY